MSVKTSRIIWIDNLKAIGMFLVIFAHHSNEIPKGLLHYIYSFHLPLFLFASGTVFTPQKYKHFLDLLAKKARTLLVHYFIFIFSCIFGLLSNRGCLQSMRPTFWEELWVLLFRLLI